MTIFTGAAPPPATITVGPWPAIRVDIAPISDPGGIAAPAPTWTTVTGRALTVLTADRGRAYDLAQSDPSTGSITLSDDDQALAGGAAYAGGTILPMRPARVVATVSGVDYPIFTGYAERWPQQWDDPAHAWTNIPLVDTFSALALADLAGVLTDTQLTVDPTLVTALAVYPLIDPAGTATVTEASGRTAGSAPLTTVLGILPTMSNGQTEWVDATPGMLVAKVGHGIQLAGSLAPQTAPWALEAWVNIPLSGVNGVDLWTDYSTQGVRLALSIDCTVSPRQMVVYLDNGSGTVTTNRYSLNGLINDGSPHQVVITHSEAAGAMQFWIDGQVQTGCAMTLAGTGVPGAALLGGRTYAGATIGHVAIYGDGTAHTAAAMGAGTIATLYQAGRTGFSGDLPGARLARVCGWGGLATDSAHVNLDVGTTVLGPAAGNLGRTALDAAKEVAASDLGVLFTAADGRFTFHSLNRRLTTVQASHVFGDRLDLGELPMAATPVYDTDPTYVINDVSVTQGSRPSTSVTKIISGAAHRVQDLASQRKFFRRRPTAGQPTLPTLEPSAAQGIAEWLVARYAAPYRRVSTVTLDPGSYPALWPVALGLEVSDRVTVTTRPLNASAATITGDYFVEKISHSASTASAKTWLTTLELSPVGPTAACIADDPVYGLADTAALPAAP